MAYSQPVVLVLGPSLSAVSGVTTHVRQLVGCRLRSTYTMVHFQVGSEGRAESRLRRALRLATGPFRLAAAILRLRARIVHINWSLNSKSYWRDLVHLAVARMCGARVVFQKHGGQLGEFARNRFFSAFVRATLRVADVIVVLSEAEATQYRAFVPGHPVTAVPNGVDAEPFLRHTRPRATPATPLRLVYLGRLVEHKGVGDVLEALAILRSLGRVMPLVVAGSGPEEAALRARTAKLGLCDQVRFSGSLHGEEKAKVVASAHVLVLATRHAEGLPYSLLEAMAAGTVPIVTDAGCIAEVVEEGRHALFVPPKDPAAIAAALKRLDDDRALLLGMSEACRQRIATAYSLKRLAVTFDNLYSRMLGQRPQALRVRAKS